MLSDFCGGTRASAALRSFEPRILGWHPVPGSVSSAGESECHRAGASPPLPPTSPPPPSYPGTSPSPILNFYLSLERAPRVSYPPIVHFTKEGHCQHRVCLMTFFLCSMTLTIHRVSRCCMYVDPVCKKSEPKPQHVPPTSWQLCGNVSNCPPHPDTPQLNTVQVSTQAGPTKDGRTNRTRQERSL